MHACVSYADGVTVGMLLCGCVYAYAYADVYVYVYVFCINRTPITILCTPYIHMLFLFSNKDSSPPTHKKVVFRNKRNAWMRGDGSRKI